MVVSHISSSCICTCSSSLNFLWIANCVTEQPRLSIFYTSSLLKFTAVSQMYPSMHQCKGWHWNEILVCYFEGVFLNIINLSVSIYMCIKLKVKFHWHLQSRQLWNLQLTSIADHNKDGLQYWLGLLALKKTNQHSNYKLSSPTST